MRVELPFDPDWVVHPGATLQDWRREQGLTVEEAAMRCSLTAGLYERIESGDEPYGVTVAVEIARGTGTTASFWIARERTFRDGLASGKTWTR